MAQLRIEAAEFIKPGQTLAVETKAKHAMVRPEYDARGDSSSASMEILELDLKIAYENEC